METFQIFIIVSLLLPMVTLLPGLLPNAESSPLRAQVRGQGGRGTAKL